MLPSNEVSKTVFVHHPEALESHQCLATTSDLNLSVPNMVTFLMAKPSSSSKTPTKHIKTLATRPSKNQRGNLKITKFNTKIIIQTSIFGVQHVNFYGCIPKIYIWKCHVLLHIKTAKFRQQSGCTMQNTWMRFLVQSRARARLWVLGFIFTLCDPGLLTGQGLIGVDIKHICM